MKKIKFLLILFMILFIPAIPINAQTLSEYASENNREIYSLESHEPSVLEAYSATTFISDEIIAQTKEITKNCTTDMEKLQAIHDWVANNIYYDNYGLANGSLVYFGNSVYEKKGAVCEGYANLTAFMCRAAGIPCRVIEGWTYTQDISGQTWTGSIGDFVMLMCGHAWNQAYVDGRWVIVDTTWDSRNYNTTTDETVTYRPCSNIYFDISLEELSKTHIACSYPLDMEKYKLNVTVKNGKVTADWYQLFQLANYRLEYSTEKSGTYTEYQMTYNEMQINVSTSIFSADTMYFRVMATEDGIIDVPSNIVAVTLPQYKVVFMDGNNIVSTQNVRMGSAAKPPELKKDGYELSWDKSCTNVVSDLTVKAVWTKKAEKTGTTNTENNTSASKPAKVTGLSVTNKKTKRLVLKWKKQVNIQHYQVQIARNRNFKKDKITKLVTTNKFNYKKNIKKGKTYYVRVRAGVYGKDYNLLYGKWSKVTKIKVKK